MKRYLLFWLATLMLALPTTAKSATPCITHSFVSGRADTADKTLIQPSNWNDCHVVPPIPGSAVTTLQPEAGAVTRTLADRITDVRSVKDFGALGNGIANDTAAIQAAVDAGQLWGAAIFIPAGVYRVSTVTISNPVKIFGGGAGTIIRSTTAASNVFQVTGGAIEISDLTFDSEITRTAGGAYVFFGTASSAGSISRFTMNNGYYGIHAQGQFQTYRDGSINNTVAGGTGILINGGGNHFIDSIGLFASATLGGSSPYAGIRVVESYQTQISNMAVYRHLVGFALSPASGKNVANTHVSNSSFTYGDTGIFVFASSTYNGTMDNFNCSICWATNNAANGATVYGGAFDGGGSTTVAVQFSNLYANLNAANGLRIETGARVRVQDSVMNGNALDGIRIGTNVSNFSIQTSQIGGGIAGFGNSGWGINIQGTSDFYQILNNDLTGNALGLYSTLPGTNKQITHNMPATDTGDSWSSGLTAGLPLIGGGVGLAPTIGTRSGTTTKYASVTGAQTANKQLAYDSSGNIVASAFDVGAAGGGGGGGMVDPGFNGLLARTSFNVTVARTLTGVANRLTVTNGDGVAGNPTVTIPDAAQLNVAKLVNLTTNGFIKTSSADGSLLVDTATYLASVTIAANTGLSGLGTPGSPLTTAPFVASGASHAPGAVPDPGASGGTTKFLREDATWVVPSGSGAGTLQAAFDGGKIITNANSLANAMQVGDGTNAWCIYRHSSLGLRFEPCTAAAVRQSIQASQTGGVYSDTLAADILTIDPAATAPVFTYAAGKKVQMTANATYAGLQLASYAGQPSTPAAGDLNNNAGGLEFYSASAWRGIPLMASTSLTASRCLATDANSRVTVAAENCGSFTNPTFVGLLTVPTAKTTMSGNATLTTSSASYQFFDPNGSNRDVTLPTAATGQAFSIKNIGTANTLTIKSSGGTTITTASPGSKVTVVYDSAAWQVL